MGERRIRASFFRSRSGQNDDRGVELWVRRIGPDPARLWSIFSAREGGTEATGERAVNGS